MSQAVITQAFEQWKAQQAATNEAVTLDEFVFANIPDLDVDAPIDREETMPPVAQIVHRQTASNTGVVNDNAVAYSVVLGADTGDFTFNWVGLINKASGTLAMIVHAPEQQKLKTKDGQQGNVLTRSFLMEFNGAQTETQIETPAETWQIDFTARMTGMDERQRLENIDIYGAAAFFGDGWLVGKTGNQYFVTKGAGYVAGLRAVTVANQNITVTTKPVKVWLDVCWTGTLTSVWDVQCKITVAANLADYIQNGEQHYVFALAGIDANGIITDLRPKGTLNEQVAGDALKKHEQSRNHPDATTSAKGFVQLSSATDSDSEKLAATPKAVKAANDNANTRLAKNQNGGDIPDTAKFRENLGLGELGIGGTGSVLPALDWQTFDFVPGARYAVVSGNMSNVPDGIVVPGDAYNTTINVTGYNGASRQIEIWYSTVTAANYYHYEVWLRGVTNSREFTVRQIWTSADTIPVSNLGNVVENPGYLQNTAPRRGRAWIGFGNSDGYSPGAELGIIAVESSDGAARGAYQLMFEAGLFQGKQDIVHVYVRGTDDASDLADATSYEIYHSGNIGSILPTGVPVPWSTATAPSGWLKCNGATFDKAKYPGLATAYPSGKLPDLRGEFIRGWDDGRGVDSGRAILSAQAHGVPKISGHFPSYDIGENPTTTGPFAYSVPGGKHLAYGSSDGTDLTVYFDSTLAIPAANEVRPRNIAFNYIVRAA